MALMAIAFSTKFPFHCNASLLPEVPLLRSVSNSVRINGNAGSLKSSIICDTQQALCTRLLYPYGGDFRNLSWPICAVGSGLEASITDSEENDINLKNVKIVVESRDDDKIHVRVDVSGEETEKAFDVVVTNLARTAPPVPGFRRKKGGKTSNVPKSFLLQILGRARVTKFVIQEIVSSTMADYVKKASLKVKNKFKTTQAMEELELAFTPGSEFGFNATMDIEKSQTETTSSSESEKSETETISSSSDV
ncbi:bacterial trigger factor isoform X2 [Tasmannia lanceolata]|uniref:bacterial trigger factor isoform X2 n=1 Tax=Tasmannia lanceolata TaxID=3420 RepID=UPI0040633E76